MIGVGSADWLIIKGTLCGSEKGGEKASWNIVVDFVCHVCVCV